MMTFLSYSSKKILRSPPLLIVKTISGWVLLPFLAIKKMGKIIFQNGPWDKNSDKGKAEGSPWGKNTGTEQKKASSPNDPIDMLQRRFKKTFHQGGGQGGIPNFSPSLIGLGVGAVIFMWAATGFYRVQEGELGVVTRFGEMIRISSPGLRYHIPSPIENVIVIKVSAVNIINGGVRGNKVSEETSEKTLILTGDENMVHTNYTVLWKIKDVKDFLFNARQPEATIKVAAESVIREVIGQTNAKAALTEGRNEIESKAQVLLQKLMDQYKLGVETSIQLQNVAPPQEVVESFNGLQASLTKADSLRNKAEAYRNDILPRAEGQAIQIIQEAEAEGEKKIAEAQGRGALISSLSPAYQENPELIIKRKHLEVMSKILSKVKNKVIIEPKVGNNILPYLPLKDSSSLPTATGPERANRSTDKGAQQ